MMQEVKIKKLTAQDIAIFDTVCQWHYHWWGKRDGFTLEQVMAYVKHSVCENRVPQTFVALLADEPVGMYQFLMYDNLIHRPDIYPWIGNVFVAEAYRGQGISQELMRSVEKYAKAVNLETLFLYTDMEGFYEKFGWVFVDMIETFREKSPYERLYKLDIKK